LVSVSGSIGKQVIYLNSTYDPDNTGTGHQPLYRDTYAAIYDQYAVVSATLTVTFVINAAQACIVGAVVEDDNTTSSSVTTLMEQNLGEHRLVPMATGSPNTHTFTVKWDCKRDLGIDPYASESYKTAVGSNPTEVASMLLYAVPADGAASTTTFANITLEQVVLWTELTTPTGS